MLKRNKNVPPRDANQLARYLVDLTTGSETEEPTADEVSKVMAALGRKGGKVGGKRRLETMTQEARSAVALKAARARWKKAKRKRPTKAMRAEVASAGTFDYEGHSYPRMQMLTIREIIEDKREFLTPTKVGTRIHTDQPALPL